MLAHSGAKRGLIALSLFTAQPGILGVILPKTSKGFPKRLSDEDIVSLMLMIDPDLTHMEISQQFSTSEFVLMTKEGARFQGVMVGITDETVKLRQVDGTIVHVLKSAVAAVRRP